MPAVRKGFRNQVKSLRLKGYTMKKIAEILGVDKKVVRDIINS